MIFVGYDPGGNGKQGVAALDIDAGRTKSIVVKTLFSAEHVLDWFLKLSPTPQAIGVDTLTNWSTGPSGLRPADRWLREKYPEVAGSVMASNSLYGAMSVNGMAVLKELRDKYSNLVITETHPKVLHFHLCKQQFDFNESDDSKSRMNKFLEDQLGTPVDCQTDHEWDAAASALAAYRWHSRKWINDLHLLPRSDKERSIQPCGSTHYAWPSE